MDRYKVSNETFTTYEQAEDYQQMLLTVFGVEYDIIDL